MRIGLMAERKEGCLFDDGECPREPETPDSMWCGQHAPVNCACHSCGEQARRSCAHINGVPCGILLCPGCVCPYHG